MTTQLNYDITSDKEPLYTTVDQLNPSTADFTVSAVNASREPVTISAIEIELVKLTGGQLILPGSAAGIELANRISGPGKATWNVKRNEGRFMLTASASGAVFQPEDKLSFTLRNVKIREGATGAVQVPVFERSAAGQMRTEVDIVITQSVLDVKLWVDGDKTLIDPGESAMLKWLTVAATSGVLTLPGSSPDTIVLNSTNLTSGQQSVTPAANVTYSLTCKGREPDVTKEVTISIRPVKIDSFSGSATSFAADGSTTLSWKTRYATACLISTQEGSGNVQVPVQNNQTASCKVTATADGSTLILSKVDGAEEFGRLTLPTECPSSVSLALTADGPANTQQEQFIVTLLRPKINRFYNEQVAIRLAAGSAEFAIKVHWEVVNAGSVQVFFNQNQISTLPSGAWQSSSLSGRELAKAEIKCTGFGGPVSLIAEGT